MLAFKCDICGKLFEEERRYNNLRICCTRTEYRLTDKEIEERKYDICPKCMDSISSLIQVLKPENHTINKERSE